MTQLTQPKIKVSLEGRNNIFIPEKESLVDFIKKEKATTFHGMEKTSFGFLGCDYNKEQVIQFIDNCDRVALLFIKDNIVDHPLRIIKGKEMKAFDIPVTPKNLQINN
jgi:hypothetical protein